MFVNESSGKCIPILLLSLGAFHSPVSHAQTLEEVVVTAQRRVQNLQDVPISIETVSGEAIRDGGFRDLKELANFAPGLVLDEEGMEGQGVTIRGAGTQGKNLGMEQAAPTFVDGIHFGRNSSITRHPSTWVAVIPTSIRKDLVTISPRTG